MAVQKERIDDTAREAGHNQPDREQRGGDGQHLDGQNGMVSTAEQVTEHYVAPTPLAEAPAPNPFPRAVMRGLGLGALAGALLGVALGWFFASGTLVVPGWEQMYSIGAFTMYTLWTMFGVALGVITIGISTILVTKPEPAPEAD